MMVLVGSNFLDGTGLKFPTHHQIESKMAATLIFKEKSF